MTAALLFLRANWKVIGSVAVVLALLLGVYLKGRADDAAHWRPLVAAAQADLKRCRDNTAALQASIASQNAQLQAKADVDAKTLASATKALEQAQKGRSGAEARAAHLISTPAPGVDACARAVAARKQVLEQLQ